MPPRATSLHPQQMLRGWKYRSRRSRRTQAAMNVCCCCSFLLAATRDCHDHFCVNRGRRGLLASATEGVDPKHRPLVRAVGRRQPLVNRVLVPVAIPVETKKYTSSTAKEREGNMARFRLESRRTSTAPKHEGGGCPRFLSQRPCRRCGWKGCATDPSDDKVRCKVMMAQECCSEQESDKHLLRPDSSC